jgi:DNA polymerase III subunit epsilon
LHGFSQKGTGWAGASSLLWISFAVTGWITFAVIHWITIARKLTMGITFSQASEVLGEIRTAFLEEHPPEIIDNTRHNTIKWASSLLESKRTVIIDTETTGLSENDEIIQLTIIDLQGKILLETLLKPVQPISLEASEVHGITIEAVANSPTFCDLYTEITRLLYEQAVVAYNAAFDQRMLAQTCRKYGLPDINSSEWHCAMNKYSQYWSGQSETNNRLQSLSSACRQQGIPVKGTHDATNDCLLTLQLIKAMAETDPKGSDDLKQNLSRSKN